MKRYMLVMALVLGVFARPQPLTVQEQGHQAISQEGITTPAPSQAQQHELNAAQMNSQVGGDIAGCYTIYDDDLDEHLVCCVNLWLFTICAGVNVSALERLIPF